MKKTILALTLAVGLASFAGSAKAALTYNWSMAGNGQYGTSSDTVGGLLTLNDAGTQATSLTVTFDQGGNVHFLNTINFAEGASDNSFAVSDNKITQAIFSSNINGEPSYNLLFNYYGSYNSYTSSLYDYGNQQFVYFETVNNDTGLEGITFTPVSGATAAVPEPSQVAASILLIGGIVGFVIVRRRKESELARAA